MRPVGLDLLPYRDIANHLKRRGWTVHSAFGKYVRATNADREIVVMVAPRSAHRGSASGRLAWQLQWTDPPHLSAFRSLKELDGLLGRTVPCGR